MSTEFRVWILANSAFVAAVYAGLFWNLYWLTIAAAVVVWIALAAYFTLYISKDSKNRTDPAPPWLGLTVDAVVLVAWLSQGWYITGTAYLASMILITVVHSRSQNQGNRLPRDAESVDGVGRDLEIAVKVGQWLSRYLDIPSRQLGFVYRRVPQDSRADYLLGFINSAADVIAQSYGAKSGSNASINGTLRALSAAFGSDTFEPYFHRTVALHDNPTAEFNSGFLQGNSWAIAVLQQRSDEATLITLELFGSKYADCIG